MPLTDTRLRALKAKEAAYRVTDMGGLYLNISPSGKRSWRYDYTFHGRRLTLTIGNYPDVGLADARIARNEARRKVTEGINPSEEKRIEKGKARISTATTFGGVADEYLASLAQKSAERTIKKNTWLLKTVASSLSNRPIAEIRPLEILEVLRKVSDAGKLETANRLRTVIGSLYRRAVLDELVVTDPTFPLRGALEAPTVTNRAAITDPKKLGGLLCKIDDYDGWSTLRDALLFTALTFARPGEVRFAKWDEIDLETATWSIPAHRTKMRRPHDVPLTRQSRAILHRVRKLGKEDSYIFPAIRSVVKPLSENAMNSALRRMGYSKEDMTAHGFRATASSILNESKQFRSDVIELQLAHLDKNKIRRTYNRALYWNERVEMMQKWSDMLDDFRERSRK